MIGSADEALLQSASQSQDPSNRIHTQELVTAFCRTKSAMKFLCDSQSPK